ncbi:MAG TPA: hypothetical protein PKC58_08135 [Ignavibacteria bacterium]|nr:hypothetical protein [Ignavibacteria bacterium]
MFENIVDSWTENESGILDNLYKSLKGGDYLNRIMILNSDLKDFTKNYLLYEFDEESSPEELRSRISKANKLYFNYALRPKWTLRTFLFNNFESRPPNEILKKLNIFTFYNYYSDSIKDAMKDNFQIFITKTELSSIIDSVNLTIYEKLSRDISSIKIKNFLLQLFLIRYENESEYNLESTIPYSFLKIFLEDKSYPDFIDKFSVVKDLDTHTEISLKDIIKILTGKYITSGSPDTEDATPKNDESVDIADIVNIDNINTIDNEEIKAEEAELPINTSDTSENITIEDEEVKENISETESEILIDDYEAKPEFTIKPMKGAGSKKIDLTRKSEGSNDADIIKKSATDKNIKENNSKDKSKNTSGSAGDNNDNNKDKEKTGLLRKSIFKKTPEEDLSRNKQTSEKNEISNLFDEKRSEKILKKVYKSDLILMDMSFSKLKNIQNWEEASAQLKQVFKRNDVDIYNKDVVFFVDKLNEYFKNKK